MKQPIQGLSPAARSSAALPEDRYSPLYGPPDSHPTRCATSSVGAFFSDLDATVLARADSMGLVEMDKSGLEQQPLKPEDLYGHTPDFTMGGQGPTAMCHMPSMGNHSTFNAGSDSMFDALTPDGAPGIYPVHTMAEHRHHHHHHLPPNIVMNPSAVHDFTTYSTEGHHQVYSPIYSSAHPVVVNTHLSMPSNYTPSLHTLNTQRPHHPPQPPQPQHPYENDCDPLELERFAEKFKQRRIKLGVTQADVGSALAELKIPGVGSLSQSTICRFESLTLSHNNMIALKPILLTWLEEAEQRAYERQAEQKMFEEKKRKRTSITAPEKRSLEAYFAVQPRPSGEKIAQIAEKLELKKNVVRVWFCNQRQKQKRLKFSATAIGHH